VSGGGGVETLVTAHAVPTFVQVPSPAYQAPQAMPQQFIVPRQAVDGGRVPYVVYG
jgi:hypothetical protein